MKIVRRYPKRYPGGFVSGKTVGVGVFFIIAIAAMTLVVLQAANLSAPESAAELSPRQLSVEQKSSRETQESAPAVKEIPAEVKSYSGVVVSVEEHSFTFEARKEANYLTKDTRLTTELTPSTLFLRVISPKTVRAHQSIASLTRRERMTPAGLKVGDQVVVTAKENVKDQTSFTAASVEVWVVE